MNRSIDDHREELRDQWVCGPVEETRIGTDLCKALDLDELVAKGIR